jgi:hypothetical protein
MTAPIGGAAATRQLAILESLLTGSTCGDEASDGPGEPCIAPADLDWFADRAAERDERWRDGAA